MWVIGNWKMYGGLALLQEMVEGLPTELPCQVAVAPPAVYVPRLAALLEDSPVRVVAQDCSQHSQSGAYTGEVSAQMLVEVGAQMVILGHSERRSYHQETDEQIAHKFMAAKQAGLTPILCVGETLEHRKAGATAEVVQRQLGAVLAEAGAELFSGALIAYEPVWAIGTGVTASPEQAQAVHDLLRKQLAGTSQDLAANTPILYGGSVKPDNAAELFAMPDIDGGLIGGASLQVDSFNAIIAAAS